MNALKFRLLILSIILVYTQGMWERLFFMSSIVMYVIDVNILIAILFNFKYSFKAPGSSFFIFFLIYSFFLGFANDNSIIESFLYLRYVIFSYLLYNQFYSSSLKLNQWGFLIKLFVVLVILQGIGSAFNVFVLNQRVEGYVGIMSSLGGTTATVFPVFVSVLVFVFFFLKVKMTKANWVWCGLLLFSVLLVGYSSGKRGIYFYVPVYIFMTSLVAGKYLYSFSFFKKKMVNMSLVFVLLFPLFIFGIQNSRGFSYSLDGSESAIQTISTAVTYAESYEGSEDQYGRTTGRSNTTIRIFDYSLTNLGAFCLGEGYGSTKKSIVRRKYGFEYGIVGFTRDIVSGGWFLMLGIMFLFYKMIFANKSFAFKASKIFRIMMGLLFVGIHLFYSSDFTVGLKLTFMFIPLLVLVNSPQHADVLKSIISKHKFIY